LKIQIRCLRLECRPQPQACRPGYPGERDAGREPDRL